MVFIFQNKLQKSKRLMLRHKPDKHRSRSRPLDRDKINSPNLLRVPKTNKTKLASKQQLKLSKKTHTKHESNCQQSSAKNCLFISLQQLPQVKTSKPHHRKLKKKASKNTISNHNIEDSTASRQFKHCLKQYDSPNGQYFGSKISSLEPKHKQKHISQGKNKPVQPRKARSLQRKLKHYRKLSGSHRSESQSLKSEISEKEMHRLQKIHSIEKMMLMEEIMAIEEKRLGIKHKK